MEKQTLCMPPDLPECEEVMTNFDHSIRAGADDDLKAGSWGRHPGWNFHGHVWWQDGQFHEEVWCYHSHVDTLSADTLEELMQAVNDEFGWE